MECGKHPEPGVEGRRPGNKEARQWAGKTQHNQMCRTGDGHRGAIPGALPRAQDGCPCGSALISASPHGACQLSGSASSGFSEQQPGFSLSFEPSCHRPRGSGEDMWQRDMLSPLSFAPWTLPVHLLPWTVPTAGSHRGATHSVLWLHCTSGSAPILRHVQ